jgi:hypothetical protein
MKRAIADNGCCSGAAFARAIPRVIDQQRAWEMWEGSSATFEASSAGPWSLFDVLKRSRGRSVLPIVSNRVANPMSASRRR